MLINAERDAIETLDPKLENFEWLSDHSSLSDGTPLQFLGFSRRGGGDTAGKVIVFRIADSEKRKGFEYSERMETKNCEYAVLLRKPTESETQSWINDTGRKDVSPLVFERLRIHEIGPSENTVFALTGKCKVWAQLTIT